MEVILVGNAKNGEYKPHGAGGFIRIEKTGETEVGGLEKIKLFLSDIEDKTELEIAPGKDKVGLKTFYASDSGSCLVYATANVIGLDKFRINFYIFNCAEGTEEHIASVDTPITGFMHDFKIKCIVLDSANIIVQTEKYSDEAPGEINLRLFTVGSDEAVRISNSIIEDRGIEEIYPINDKFCALRIGKGEGEVESIGYFLINQVLSELSLKIPGDGIKILDESGDGIEFTSFSVHDGIICWSVFNKKEQTRVVKLYNHETQVEKVRIDPCSGEGGIDVRLFIADGEPVLVAETVKNSETEVVDLSVQNVVCAVRARDQVAYIGDDILVMSEKERSIITGREKGYIVVYRYPDIYEDPLLREVGVFKDLIKCGEKLIIFIE